MSIPVQLAAPGPEGPGLLRLPLNADAVADRIAHHTGTDAIRLAELLWLLPTAAEAWLEAPVSALMLSELLAELALEPVLAVVRAETEQLNCRSM